MCNPEKIEKWRLAILIGISSSTLSRMLNHFYFDELKKLNYRKNQKFLFKHQLNYLFPAGIDFEFKK